MHYWEPVGAWYTWERKAVWQGPEQKEDRSPENIRRCYSFLRRLPYQSEEDKRRLEELELIAVTEAVMTDGPQLP